MILIIVLNLFERYYKNCIFMKQSYLFIFVGLFAWVIEFFLEIFFFTVLFFDKQYLCCYKEVVRCIEKKNIGVQGKVMY